MSPVVGVLALQGDVTEHLRALEQAGARPLAVRRPTELDEAAGLIIRGGESTTIWKLAETFGLADPLRKRVASGMARRRPLPRRVYPRPVGRAGGRGRRGPGRRAAHR